MSYSYLFPYLPFFTQRQNDMFKYIALATIYSLAFGTQEENKIADYCFHQSQLTQTHLSLGWLGDCQFSISVSRSPGSMSHDK
jgi:hypothetical protein